MIVTKDIIFLGLKKADPTGSLRILKSFLRGYSKGERDQIGTPYQTTAELVHTFGG